MKMTGGALTTTMLTKRQELEEGSEYRQILPAAEVTMKNETDKPSLDNISRGYYEKYKLQAQLGKQQGSQKGSSYWKAMRADRPSHQQSS